MASEALIIGGGIIGLSIARELKRSGLATVTILDRGPLGAESSWAAAGMLAPNIEADSDEVFHRFGIESLGLYPDLADRLRDETGIDIELDTSGTLCLAFSDAEAEKLTDVYSRQRSRGVTVDQPSPTAIRDLEPAISGNLVSGLFYPSDWQVENRRLLSALRRSVELDGVAVIENVEVGGLLTDGKNVIGARTPGGEEFLAGVTVVATGAWTSLIKIADEPVSLNVRPIRGQMISFGARAGLTRHVVYSPRGYIVPRADGRLLVGATVEDVGFDKNTTESGVASLTAAAIEIVPELKDYAIAEKWAGLRPYVVDELPVLGELPGFDNVLVATAHYRNGILLAPVTAKIIAEKIVDGRHSEYFDRFAADRFRVTAANAKLSGS